MSVEHDPQKLTDAIENVGREWRNYSGRGMMGAQCVGVELQSISDLFQLGQELEGFSSPKIDDMGRGIIAYWPRFKCIDDAA